MANAFEKARWIVAYRPIEAIGFAKPRIEAAGTREDMEMIAERRNTFFQTDRFFAEEFDSAAWNDENWAAIELNTSRRIAANTI